MDEINLNDLIQGVKDGLKNHTKRSTEVEFELCINGNDNNLKILPCGSSKAETSKIKFKLEL